MSLSYLATVGLFIIQEGNKVLLGILYSMLYVNIIPHRNAKIFDELSKYKIHQKFSASKFYMIIESSGQFVKIHRY